MARQLNSIIATQTVPFRGTSAVDVFDMTTAIAPFKAITGAVYSATLAGGQSGTFGIHVLGSIGGATYIVAGFTALAATVGNYVLYPATYTSAGALSTLETATSAATKQIDQIVPPTKVVFQSGIATHGISTTITVSACITGAY